MPTVEIVKELLAEEMSYENNFTLALLEDIIACQASASQIVEGDRARFSKIVNVTDQCMQNLESMLEPLCEDSGNLLPMSLLKGAANLQLFYKELFTTGGVFVGSGIPVGCLLFKVYGRVWPGS